MSNATHVLTTRLYVKASYRFYPNKRNRANVDDPICYPRGDRLEESQKVHGRPSTWKIVVSRVDEVQRSHEREPWWPSRWRQCGWFSVELPVHGNQRGTHSWSCPWEWFCHAKKSLYVQLQARYEWRDKLFIPPTHGCLTLNFKSGPNDRVGRYCCFALPRRYIKSEVYRNAVICEVTMRESSPRNN